MPKTRLDRFAQLPPVDLLKACVLERMNLRHNKVTAEMLAARCDMSVSNMRKLLSEKHTADWSRDQRKAVCKALGLEEGRISATEYYYENLPKLFQK